MMQRVGVFLSLIFLLSACQMEQSSSSKRSFDQEKWAQKEGKDYPHRNAMVEEVLYNDTIRTLSQSAILDLLGEADRVQEDHHYYTIRQRRLGLWVLHTKTLVIKYTPSHSIEWIKLHE